MGADGATTESWEDSTMKVTEQELLLLQGIGLLSLVAARACRGPLALV